MKDYIPVPDVYPAGRLDWDSEGLLLLTDDGALQARIASPRFHLPKTYLAQVEGEPGEAELARLRRGITLKDGPCRPAPCRTVDAPALWPRIRRCARGSRYRTAGWKSPWTKVATARCGA